MSKNRVEIPLEDMTFEELVSYVTYQLHAGLLEGGGKEFKQRVHLWLGQAITWAEEQKSKKPKRPKRHLGDFRRR